jgi:hypothetical protein
VKRLLPLVLSILTLVVVACGAETTAPDAAGDQGVRGVVLLGPRCPVETDASPCPDEPLPGITVRVLRDGEPINATATSDVAGRFELRLPPGRYTLEAIVPEGGPGMSAKPIDVTVTAGGYVDVVVPVDTGIR